MPTKQKHDGAYFTPIAIANTLVQWVTRRDSDRLLDPSCGDGRFLSVHPNSFGVDRDEDSLAEAGLRAPSATLIKGEFFNWASSTNQRFDCAAGNPPFIRYQTFAGDTRLQAILLCRALGAQFSGLTSSWAPFLVAAASLLKPGGRLAFVVPAEIGHAPYAAPLLEYLAANFSQVEIVAVRDKLFPELSEDCWLLYASGYGGKTAEFGLTAVESFRPTSCPPRGPIRIPVAEWRTDWNRRLRPFLLGERVRLLYRRAASSLGSKRLGDIASVNIGYVTGDNDFFHLRPSTAERFEVPETLLHPSVRNGRSLPELAVTAANVHDWTKADEPTLLLRLPQTIDLPSGVTRYLETEQGHKARSSYKCRMRKPWYSVPDVKVPDYFLTYMSGRNTQLVRNDAGCVCTNALHAVNLRDKADRDRLVSMWNTPFVNLSCEIEGHPLGGGMLKLEPREASSVILPSSSLSELLTDPDIQAGVSTMRSWRHIDN